MSPAQLERRRVFPITSVQALDIPGIVLELEEGPHLFAANWLTVRAMPGRGRCAEGDFAVAGYLKPFAFRTMVLIQNKIAMEVPLSSNES